MSPPIHLKWMTLRRSKRGTLLMGHPFEPFSLTGGSHTSVMDIKKSRSNPRYWSSKQTLWAEPKIIPVQQGAVSMPNQYFDTTNHKKSQCDFAFKADQVPKLWATTWSDHDLCQLMTNNHPLTKSPSWEWIESQFHKTYQVPKLWAIIWSSLDFYQLLTSNQLYIKSNPNEHQYKSNWCLIGGSFCKESLFGRDTELQVRNEDFIQKKTWFSWQIKF
jgi:hypothetical protein